MSGVPLRFLIVVTPHYCLHAGVRCSKGQAWGRNHCVLSSWSVITNTLNFDPDLATINRSNCQQFLPSYGQPSLMGLFSGLAPWKVRSHCMSQKRLNLQQIKYSRETCLIPLSGKLPTEATGPQRKAESVKEEMLYASSFHSCLSIIFTNM